MPDKIIYEEFGGTAASESYVDDGWGLVRLVSTGMNKRRVDAGAMRYHVDHDWTKPVGIIDDLRYDGEVIMITGAGFRSSVITKRLRSTLRYNSTRTFVSSARLESEALIASVFE